MSDLSKPHPMTDLKAAAEAAKAAHAGKDLGAFSEAWAAWERACTPDAILALIRERDEALTAYRAVKDSLHTMKDRSQSAEQQIDRLEGEKIEQAAEYESVIKGIEAERNTAEASLASYKEEVERLRGALGTIADLHIPDQPAHFGGDELEWAQRHVGTLRRLAIETLTKEPPHAG